jgi:hypothetical protein
MFEHRHEALLPYPIFIRRVIRHVAAASLILAATLGIGMWGYHALENLSWVDALLNASMILGGMGPVDTLYTTAGKLFASAYALFSGIVFLATSGVLLAPFLHRLMHRFHLESR